MGTETIDIPVDDVVVGSRVRKKLGDMRKLTSSMERRGQLQPIAVDPDNNLLFGFRRLMGARALGWETIRAERHPDPATAIDRTSIECDENECREPFTIEEAVEIKRMIEGVEAPKAEKRQKSGGKTPAANFAEGQETGRTRDRVTKETGYSHETLRKAQVVLEAAKAPKAPPAVKEAAATMVETGKVDPAFKAVQEATNPPDDGERLRSTLLTRLDVVRDIHALCDSPAGKNVKQAKALKAHGELVAAIKGEKPVLDPIAEIELPAPLDTPQFRHKWREWCKYRRERKPAVSADAARKTFAKLIKVPLASAMQAIDDAISNDWRGIFPERSKPSKSVIGPGQTYDPHAAEKDPDHGKL